jgi:hypothetical protein
MPCDEEQAASVVGRGHLSTTRQALHFVISVDPESQVAEAPGDLTHRSQVAKRTQEFEMSTSHHSRTALSAFVTALMVALSVPIAGNAEDEVLADEQVLAVEGQDSALVLIAADATSWDETSGYGAVETNRASFAEDGVPTALISQGSADVRWAPDTGPAWLAESRAAAAQRTAPEFPEWDSARWAPIEAGRKEAVLVVVPPAGPPPQHSSSLESSASPPLRQAINPDSIPAALASGQRAESAHLAMVPLPAEDTVDGALAEC